MSRTLPYLFVLGVLAVFPARNASAAPDCASFISALKDVDPNDPMDKDGEKLFTKVCARNSDAAVSTATACLKSGKGGGNQALDKCLKPLK